MSEEEKVSLYRCEYFDSDNDEFIVSWMWLKEEEVAPYVDSLSAVFRQATKDEEDLYNEAYADGYSNAALKDFESKYDGITFRVEFDENGNLITMNGKKMFQCAVCDRTFDFEEFVASAGGMYLGAIRNENLWHICYDCAQGRAEVEWIEQGWVWDDDSWSTDEKNS